MKRAAASLAEHRAAAAEQAHEPETVRRSPALEPPPGNPRFPLVDPLRGIAILLVVVYHAAATSGASRTNAIPQIANTIAEQLTPLGVGVVLEAEHLCMRMRGVEKQNSTVVTSAMLGVFRKNAQTREEFVTLIRER